MKVLEELHPATRGPRLIPTFKQQERNLLSVFMSLLDVSPQIRSEFLSLCGYGAGRTCLLRSYMEPQFRSDRYSSARPDGLLVCRRGKSNWSAFVEAKCEGKPIRPEQIKDYAALAKSLGVDAVISISNEYSLDPEELPFHVSQRDRQSRCLYHFSWAQVRTLIELLKTSDGLTDRERWVVSECLEFFWSERTGIKTYDAMPKDWPDFVEASGTSLGFGTKTEGITDIVHGWHQERRDLAAKLSHNLGSLVTLVHSAGTRATEAERMKYDRDFLAKDYCLEACFRFPNSKSLLRVKANLNAKATTAAIEFAPPQGKKAKATATWLAKQCEQLEMRDLTIAADWKGRGNSVEVTFTDFLKDPQFNFETFKDAPRTIRLIAQYQNVRRFKSRKGFVEDLEALVLNFVERAKETDLVEMD